MGQMMVGDAERMEADSFSSEVTLTTDDGIIKKAKHIKNIQIVDPIGFIKEVSI